jgi:hypothetical protein
MGPIQDSREFDLAAISSPQPKSLRSTAESVEIVHSSVVEVGDDPNNCKDNSSIASKEEIAVSEDIASNAATPNKDKAAMTDFSLPSSLLTELKSLPREVLPPNPPTGETTKEEGITFVTELLEKFAVHRPLVARYHRGNQRRAVDQFERGFWQIDVKHWPLRDQILFWKDLIRFVGNGRVGLATWCTREHVSPIEEEKAESIGTVNVFCWGEIVMHVYIFLYTIADGHLRRQSAEWIDAEGEVVVHVHSSTA